MTHTTDPVLMVGLGVVVASFTLIHLLRRWPTLRSRLNLSNEITFARTQRMLHWTIGIGCAVLLFSGLPIYLAQFLVIPPVPTPLRFYYWGLQVVAWRTFHIYFALLVVLLIFIHSLWDTYRVKPSQKIMNFSRGELAEAKRRVRSFLGSSNGEPTGPTEKYDFFHKAFHWSLLGLGAFLLISGLIEWEAFQIQGVPVFVLLDRFNHEMMDGFLRTGHLVAGILFGGLAAIHIYFSVLPQNRPFLRAMVLGKSRSESMEGAGR